jgi:thiamine biosynthesis protein ThiI
VEDALKNIYDSVIVRFSGELWLKKVWTRKYYEKRLATNIKQTLKHYHIEYIELVRRHSRFYLKTSSALEASNILTRVFGISSVSPGIETSSEFDNVIQKSVQLAEILLKKGNSFAVRCKRVGNQDYSSADVQKILGQKILDTFGKELNLRVDLSNPDVLLGVEIRDNQTFVYSHIIDAVGGMPLGVQSRLVGLFSGGIDSAVGMWLVMKRGCPIVPVYFDNNPFTDDTTTLRALKVAKVLFDWAVGFPRKVYIVHHGENMKHIRTTNKKYSCLLCKRMMYRVAERLAGQLHAEGIVTGEAIGEQASQTITNLRVLDAAAKDYPIHRPLLGFDKEEIEAIGRRIGTYEFSNSKAGACTAVPYQPSTKAKMVEVLKAEEKLDIEAMIEQSLKSIKIIEV